MRKAIYYLILTALLWYVLVHSGEVAHTIQLALHGNWLYLILAALLQVGGYYFLAVGYQRAFRTVGIERTATSLIPPLLSSLSLNVLAPTLGFGSTALFLDEAQREGTNRVKAVVAPVLAVTSEIAVFFMVALVVLGVLSTTGQLPSILLIPLLLIAASAGGLVVGVFLLVRHPALTSRVFRVIGYFANLPQRWRREDPASEDWAIVQTKRWEEAVSTVNLNHTYLIPLGFAFLTSQCLGFLSLLAIFAAFNLPVFSTIPLLTYVVSVMFTIVSPTPQGVGIVEGAMSVVATAQGLAGPVATTVTLVYRLLSFWLPLLVGITLLRRTRSFAGTFRPLSREWVVRTVAILTAITGGVSAVSAIRPALANRLLDVLEFVPLSVTHEARIAAAVFGLILMLLAFGLWRRKRTAWILTIVVLLATIISHLVKGFDYEEAGITALLTTFLIRERKEFYALSDEPTYQQGIQVGIMGAIFTLVYGVTGLYLLDSRFLIHFSLVEAVKQTFALSFYLRNPAVLNHTHHGHFFANSLYAVATTSLLITIASFLRPALLRHGTTSQERLTAAKLTAEFGKVALAEIALLPDKTYLFPSPNCFVAYAVRGWSAIALGDPVGPGDAIPPAIHAFQQHCERHDWEPCFYQVTEKYLEFYATHGFKYIKIGHEGYVDLTTFTLEGSDMKNVRNSTNRLNREGYTAEVVHPPHTSVLLASLRRVSNQWLSAAKGREKQFSLGWFDEVLLQNQSILVVRSAEGEIIAFTTLLTHYRPNELSFDLMRYGHSAPNGTMDFLFVQLMLWAGAAGYERLSLGLSPLAGVGEHPEDHQFEKLQRLFFQRINQFYNFQGLHRYKEKFSPSWEPRYLIYPNTTALATAIPSLLQMGKR